MLGLWRAGGDLAEVTEEEPRSGGHHLSGCSEDMWHTLVSVLQWVAGAVTSDQQARCQTGCESAFCIADIQEESQIEFCRMPSIEKAARGVSCEPQEHQC